MLEWHGSFSAKYPVRYVKRKQWLPEGKWFTQALARIWSSIISLEAKRLYLKAMQGCYLVIEPSYLIHFLIPHVSLSFISFASGRLVKEYNAEVAESTKN